MDLLSRNVHVNVPAPKAVSSLSAIDRWSDYIGHLVGDSRHLGNTSHTMKPSDPLLLAYVTLRCGMYPEGKVDISQHLVIPGFPQSDHTVGKPSADAGSLCSEA
jgi:hypothetical protein